MVTLMNILAKQTAHMAMLLSIFVGLLATEGLAAKKGEPAVTHISFADSAKNHLVNIRAQISDSVLVTNLANAPTHYDNAMFVRLFLDGHFTQAFHFDARVMVSNDYTNRYHLMVFNSAAIEQGVAEYWIGDECGTSVDEIWGNLFGHAPGE